MESHEVRQQPRWHGDATFFLDLGGDDLPNAYLEVGRRQLQSGRCRLQQNVIEDR